MIGDRVSYEAISDVGIKRSHNQDSYGIALARNETGWRTQGHVFVVADGMGAHAVGEMASKLAADTILHVYRKQRDVEPKTALEQAFQEANQIIHEKGKQNPEFKGMGTTATALAILPDGAHLAHVGDSRCYRIRGSVIEQLSFDHSLQWEIARRRNVSPENLTAVPSHVIVRSLGPQEQVVVDYAGPYDVMEGDRFLLCSDGLTGPVTDKELWSVLAHLPPRDACQFLVDLANLRGGMDNITAVLIQVGEPKSNSHGSRPNQLIDDSAERKISDWLRTVPFPGWLVITGVSMGILGYLWRDFGPSSWQVLAVVAVLALVCLGAGLGGFVRRRRHHELTATEPAPQPAPIHRRAICSLERSLCDNLARAEKILREVAIEESWKVDWTQLHQSRARAAAADKDRNLALAFREHCRSVSILSAGLPKHREKQEVFLPQWQKD